MAEDLTAAQRLRVWVAAGMNVTLTPAQLRALAEIVDKMPLFERQMDLLRLRIADEGMRAARRQEALDRLLFWVLALWALLAAADAGATLARWLRGGA